MKARVKATGEVVDVWYKDAIGVTYDTNEIDIIDCECIPDYWTRLEHQYAGMAMQGILASGDWDDCSWDIIAEDAIRAATSLVEKLKEKEERK